MELNFPPLLLSRRRPNPLFESVHHERWTETLSILRRRSGRSQARRPGQDDLTSLHMAVWLGGIPPATLKALLSAHGGACKRRDNAWGFTPLHMACYSHRSASATVSALVRSYPEACAIRDKQELTPLHRACLMASDDVLDIVRVLLLSDPAQASAEIRDGGRDAPFHLAVARIHHEVQKVRFEPLRPTAGSVTCAGGSGLPAFPHHEHHDQLSQLIDATFLILEAEARGTISSCSGGGGGGGGGGSSGRRPRNEDRDGFLTEGRKVELLNLCLRRSKCPNHRLFVYMALWEYPGLATMESGGGGGGGGGCGDGDETSSSGDTAGQLMLHAAASRAKQAIGDCHWCAGCNRGLADPHFVSQDSGESCDLTCAYRPMGGAGGAGGCDGSGEGGDAGAAGAANQSWYRKYRERLYKDVVLTMPYGCILKQIARIYPQGASVESPSASGGGGGALPLHVAVANGHTWIPGVGAIFDAHPGAVKVRDPTTKLYPFMLAAVARPGPPGDENWGRKRHLSELTTCFELLRQDPTLIQ